MLHSESRTFAAHARKHTWEAGKAALRNRLHWSVQLVNTVTATRHRRPRSKEERERGFAVLLLTLLDDVISGAGSAYSGIAPRQKDNI